MQKTSSKNMDLTRDSDYFEHSPSAQPKLLNENSYIQETIIICPFTYRLFLSYCSPTLNTFFRTKVYMSNVCREFYELKFKEYVALCPPSKQKMSSNIGSFRAFDEKGKVADNL